jgi:hypothetical protein
MHFQNGKRIRVLDKYESTATFRSDILRATLNESLSICSGHGLVDNAIFARFIGVHGPNSGRTNLSDHGYCLISATDHPTYPFLTALAPEGVWKECTGKPDSSKL